MEVVRPAHHGNATTRQSNVTTDDDNDQLPPPPAPFPTETLASSSTSSRLKNVRQHLSSVQQSCVQALSSLLPEDDDDPNSFGSNVESQSAGALSELLQVTYELADFLPSTPDLSQQAVLSPSGTNVTSGAEEEPLDTLAGHLHDLRSARTENGGDDHPSIGAVREELAWARLESLSHAVMAIARGREGSEEPPSYEHHNGHGQTQPHHALPRYEEVEEGPQARTSMEKPLEEDRKEIRHDTSSSSHSAQKEKMLHELDAVTSAIERLYSVAPQLHDQRVEMRFPRQRLHTSSGAQYSSEADKIRIDKLKMRELEEIWEMIERTHGKRLESGQKVDGAQWQSRNRRKYLDQIVDRAESSRLEDQDSQMGTVDAELARARDLRNRDQFLREIIEQSAERRLSDQDADEPDGDLTSLRLAKQQAFINEIITRSRASRLASQEYPLSVEQKVQEKRASLVDSLVEYSLSGRLENQDATPPTPKSQSRFESPKEDFDLVTINDFLMGRKGSSESKNDSARSRSNSIPLVEEGDRQCSSSITFKKIAGAVRKKSVQLASKSNAELGTSKVSYVAEHQENLRVVQIVLYGLDSSSNPELVAKTSTDLATAENTKATVTSKRDPSFHLELCLPTPVHPNQDVPLFYHPTHLEAKLEALSIPQANATIAATYALSAADLRKVQPTSICCTACERQLADVTSASASGEAGYKDLPSEHWAEMIEVWMCHDDPGFTKGLAEKTKEGFWPRDEGVLVGGSYLLIEEKQTYLSNLSTNDSVKSDPWAPISCECGEVVGKQRPKDGKPGQGTIKFSKWAISLLKDEPGSDDDESENVEPVRFPLSVFVVSDMLELSQAHASYQFVVCDEETGEPQVDLWLFNPSMRISYSRPVTNSYASSPRLPLQASNRRSNKSRRTSTTGLIDKTSQESRVLRGAKIMYKVYTSTSQPGMGARAQVETLSYPRQVCDRLVATLRESTLVYPEQKRTMGVYEIGFLERI
ncbi:hypothetical protein CI109_101111 [Kwoniella shandongensis]|uniref:Uncharacterized protein n=1 Tax=Kwoniella shandongensis TaxID=1734106 RepID=A0A5M6C9V0_9TREE|nr:uncharacterized protein CI109_001581 [Kwoniella shandongensis]KAA5530175.1 hypothetical protein CI109_001581 [Kwoniella shandongensis]